MSSCRRFCGGYPGATMTPKWEAKYSVPNWENGRGGRIQRILDRHPHAVRNLPGRGLFSLIGKIWQSLPRNAPRLLAILAEKSHFVTDEVMEER